MKKKNLYITSFAFTCLVVATVALGATPQTITIMPDPIAIRQKALEQIQASEDFQRFVKQEASRRYWEGQKKTAETWLRTIDGTQEKEQATAEQVLQKYLTAKAPDLAPLAGEISKLPRWQVIVGIIAQETNYCRTGVGASRSNCGGIKNSQTGEFKRYRSHLESIQDIAILLQKPRYAGKSPAEMNGTYCQDEGNPGRVCDGWGEHVQAVADELNKSL